VQSGGDGGPSSDRGATGSIPSAAPPFVATLALAVALPAALLVRFGASWGALMGGAGAWAIAVALKRSAVGPLRRASGLRAGSRGAATVHGAYSALCELGIAAGCFAVAAPLAVVDVVAFGAGAGVAEILFVIGSGIGAADRRAERAWAAGAARSAVVRWALFVERATTAALHVGTRGLVYLAVSEGDLAAAALAFASFAAVDGVAVYGVESGWSWFEPRVCRGFYLFVAVVAGVDCAVLAALAR
jgi:hypothetical protein